MKDLKTLFLEHEGKLIHKWDHYFPIYERYLSRYRGKTLNLLEIGVSHGGSLQLWKKYFGPGVRIFAIDVNPECKKLEEENISIYIGSQSDASFLRSVMKELPPLDVIIDDGGHTMIQQITTFEVLIGQVKEDGVYICEDTHTSYWYEYGGRLRKKGTFIEYAKALVDYLHAWHINDSHAVRPNTITSHINSIHFYDSMVVFEKTPAREKPFSLMQGNQTIAQFQEPELIKPGIVQKLRLLWYNLGKKMRERKAQES